MKNCPANLIYRALAFTSLVFGVSAILQAKAASWVTNGPLLTARISHTTTLLPNGKVLVAGGWNDSYLSSAELFDPATGKWAATGAMTTNRCFHTATLLPNGKVLVMGGYANDSPHYLSSAELYDLTTETWTKTGAMIRAHVYHSATLLSDGRVLVSGGVPEMATAEIYDPTTGTWTNTGAMNRARWYHAATLLTNGNVLVAGGDYNYLPPGVLPNAEVYSPLTGIWTSSSAMTTNRTSPTATLLPNGQVLVAGGWLMAQVQTNPPAYSSFSLASGELYDPATGNWTATTNTMTAGRNDHTASLLPNGQVLLVAGFQNGPGDHSSVELFDPVSSAWIPVTNKLNNARSHHTATLLPSGRILVVSGVGPGGLTDTTEIYDSDNGMWMASGLLASGRIWHTTTLLPNGKVLMVGGYNDNVYLASAKLYDPADGTWTAGGALAHRRRSHTATLLPDGKVLISGGNLDDDEKIALSSTELYWPAGLWTTNSPMNQPRFYHTATLLPNGRVIVAGGEDSDENSLAIAEVYDPAAGTWRTISPMTKARSRHTATLLPNGKVLIAGGYGATGSLLSAELYDPAIEAWMVIDPMATARYLHTATLLPSGQVLIAGGGNEGGSFSLSSAELYNPVSGTWIPTRSLNLARSDHTATLLPNGQTLITGGLHYNGAWVPLSSAELYDPVRQAWFPAGALATARDHHTATLLIDGTVLVAEGVGGGSSSELYNVGLGYSNSWRPHIDIVTSPLNLGNSLGVTGWHFRGISSASGGSTQNSSSDYPLVQLRSLESGQTMFLQTTNWSTNSFTSLPVWNFPPGWAMVTVFVNGIPSTSSVVNIAVPTPIETTLTGVQRLTNGVVKFAFTNNPGAVFGVLATTNLSLPLSNWTALGGITEVSSGQFQFTDPQASTNAQRFYRLHAP